MTTERQVQDRFMALYYCVEALHIKCKTDQTEESLIDVFCQFHGLASAFSADCVEYLVVYPTPDKLGQILQQIQSELACTASHIHNASHKLHAVTLLDSLSRKLSNLTPDEITN